MATIDFDHLARKYARSLDYLVALAVISGVTGLFVFDISAPRGEVDGVGYAALVALSSRFGDRAITATAAFTTLLTLMASLLVPDSGISMAGMWANRGFAILEIWIVAGIIVHRLQLEAVVDRHGTLLQANQEALGRIVHEALLSDGSREAKLGRITKLAAESIGADFCIIFQRPDITGPIRIKNMWDQRRQRHGNGPDMPDIDASAYQRAINEYFILYADDVQTSEFHRSRLTFFNQMGIRAMLTAPIVQDPLRIAVSFAFAEPHHWIDQEFAFARAVSNLISLFLATDRNAETLAALEQVSEGIVLEDREGNVRYANKAAGDLTGGMASGELLRRGEPLVGAADMRELSHQGRDLEIQRLRLPDEGVLIRLNDMTARNAGLAERRKLEEQLQRTAKMEAIGQLAGGVAHDFNNILGAILGFAGFLVQDLPQNSAEHGFAARILSACERGKGLVEQILAFARVRVVERRVADLGLILKQNEDFLAGLLPPQIALKVHRPAAALPVFGGTVQLSQLITNLLLNARDSFSAGGGVIDVTARLAAPDELEMLGANLDERHERIWGGAQPGRAYGLLQVQDCGTGIAPDILDSIFVPFFTTKGRQHGTGLGLAVVHGVVESLGGICHVRSIPGHGTLFSVYFPLASELGDVASEQPAPPGDLHGKERVLIVDDEVDIADMLSIGLERLGYETVSANDPLEALAAFREDPMAFDIVVTDQVMLGLRGLELIRRLKEIKPSLRTVLCSGYSDGANENIAREAGVDLFFRKPVDSRQVAIGIRLLMRKES